MTIVADVLNVDTPTADVNHTCVTKKKKGPRWVFIIIASLLCVIVMNLKTIMRLCKALATRIKCTLQPNRPNADAMNIVDATIGGTVSDNDNAAMQEPDNHLYYNSVFVQDGLCDNCPITHGIMEAQNHEIYDPIIEEETSSDHGQPDIDVGQEVEEAQHDNQNIQKAVEEVQKEVEEVQQQVEEEIEKQVEQEVHEDILQTTTKDAPEGNLNDQLHQEQAGQPAVAAKKRQPRKKKESPL